MSTLQQLIEQEVKKVLAEASYTEADIPKFFWLITDISPDQPEQAKQIVGGELHGVKGISDTKQIIVSWLGITRNTIVILPAKPFLEANKVSRVMYDNPHYLASKNLAAVFRLMDKSQDKDNDWSSIIRSLLDYMNVSKGDVNISRDLGTIMHYMNRGTLSATWFGKIFKTTKPTINSIKQLAAWFKKASIQVASEHGKSFVKNAKNVEVDEWERLVTEGLKSIGRIYQSEGEWLVKDDTLTIPQGSTVLVALDTMPENISDKAKEIYANPDSGGIIMGRTRDEIKQLEFIDFVKSLGLDERYNFSFISMKKFEQYRKRLWNKNG